LEDTLPKELKVDDLQLEAPLQTLVNLNWIGKLDEENKEQGGRYVLLVDPAKTLLAPLSERLLLPNYINTPKIWDKCMQPSCLLTEVL
jgi:membrane protein